MTTHDDLHPPFRGKIADADQAQDGIHLRGIGYELQQNLKLETASREHLFAQFDQKILENSQAFHGKMLEFERQKLEYDSYFQKINEAKAL